MSTDRGFTLIEVLIAVGLVALLAAGAVGATLSSRSMAVTTAAAGFDSLLDAARTTAREFPNGATIAFTPDAYGDGFVARLYHNRPGTAPLEASTIPAVEARVPLNETEALGSPAFAIALHAGGAVAGIIGPVTGGSAGAETPCPASGAYHLVFSYAGARAERTLPCRINLATTGPATLSTSPPATPASSPTVSPCVGTGCVSIPTSPNPQATCPPHYFAENATTCVNPPLVVRPATLTFTAVGVPASLSYTVHEDYYLGAFHVSDNCSGAISDTNTTGGGNGTDSIYTVISFVGNKTCAITVADDRGNTGTVSVATGSRVGLLPQRVCDPQSPARPLGTDIGPDPDGIHEDFSNGTTCAAPTAPPTPSSRIVTQGTGKQSLEVFCKKLVTGGYSQGASIWYIGGRRITISPGMEAYAPLATMTLSSTSAVTFDSAGWAVSTDPRTREFVPGSFVDAGSWTGNVWTPPAAGTYYVGQVQDIGSVDCLTDGSGYVGGVYEFRNQPYSFTGTQ